MPEAKARPAQAAVPELPTWLVSASHRIPGPCLPLGDMPQPWGTAHARRVGSPTTACGVWAVTWPYFWHLTFDAQAPATCARCARLVRDADRRSREKTATS